MCSWCLPAVMNGTKSGREPCTLHAFFRTRRAGSAWKGQSQSRRDYVLQPRVATLRCLASLPWVSIRATPSPLKGLGQDFGATRQDPCKVQGEAALQDL